MMRFFERGFDIHEGGCVSEFKVVKNSVRASVHGTGTYTVSLDIYDEDVTCLEYDCQYSLSGSYCKHMVAVLYHLHETVYEYREYELAQNYIYAMKQDKKKRYHH